MRRAARRNNGTVKPKISSSLKSTLIPPEGFASLMILHCGVKSHLASSRHVQCSLQQGRVAAGMRTDNAVMAFI